jgi:hypothetical protein
MPRQARPFSCSHGLSNPCAQRYEGDGRADAHREVRRQVTVPCRRRRRGWGRKWCGDASVRGHVIHGPHAALDSVGSARRRQRKGCKWRENCRDDDCQMNNSAPHLEASFVPRPRLSHIVRRVGSGFNRIDHRVKPGAGGVHTRCLRLAMCCFGDRVGTPADRAGVPSTSHSRPRVFHFTRTSQLLTTQGVRLHH